MIVRSRRAAAKPVLFALVCASGGFLYGQPPARHTEFRVDVNMVLLTVNVTDENHQFVHGLRPGDFQIVEDGIPQKPTIFEEGSQAPIQIAGAPAAAGTNVFILFDTSDHMYDKYIHACDAIADFVRRLDPADAVAVYTFSRNLFRAQPLTMDHTRARSALQNLSVGDDTSVYDALLLTLRDAAKVPGRKVVVLFSNGPDTASMLSPADVGRVAQNEGIPVYVISTVDLNRDRYTPQAFDLLTGQTGGKLYTALTWARQGDALVSIGKEISSAYTLGYYPGPSTNLGFRRVQVRVTGSAGKQYQVRTRAGYEPVSLDLRRETRDPAVTGR